MPSMTRGSSGGPASAGAPASASATAGMTAKSLAKPFIPVPPADGLGEAPGFGPVRWTLGPRRPASGGGEPHAPSRSPRPALAPAVRRSAGEVAAIDHGWRTGE